MNIEKIKSIINEAEKNAPAPMAIMFKDLKTGEQYGVNTSRKVPTASVYKIFIIAELVRQINEGKLNWKDRVEITDSIKSPGSGVFVLMEDGLKPTILDCARLMMIISDNTATDILFNLVGRDNILNNVIKPLNLKCTKADLTCKKMVNIYCGLPEDNPHNKFNEGLAELIPAKIPNLRNLDPYLGKLELDDCTCCEDVVKMLELYYRGQWVNEKGSEIIIKLMKACQTNSRIPRLLPPKVAVAHKTGSMDRVANDAGIVYTNNGDYILTMFYNGNLADEETFKKGLVVGDDILAHLSRDIFDAYRE